MLRDLLPREPTELSCHLTLKRQEGKQHVERDDDMLDGLLCIQSASDVVQHLYLSL
jgi:hypothetical protein